MALGLRCDDAFSEQLEIVVPDSVARNLILTGVRATICLDPRVGIEAPWGQDMALWYFFVEEAPAHGVPRLTIIYTFTESDVWLHWVDHSDAPGVQVP